MAPVMLPMASVSLRWPVQITEFNFSGSSVAMGVMIIESISGDIPNASDRFPTYRTNRSAPHTMSRSAADTCRTISAAWLPVRSRRARWSRSSSPCGTPSARMVRRTYQT